MLYPANCRLVQTTKESFFFYSDIFGERRGKGRVLFILSCIKVDIQDCHVKLRFYEKIEKIKNQIIKNNPFSKSKFLTIVSDIELSFLKRIF